MAKYVVCINTQRRLANLYKAIDLGNLVPQLDKTASEVVENQKDALVQRKELAQKTKDFRKLEDSEKLIEWKALLKGIAVAAFNIRRI